MENLQNQNALSTGTTPTSTNVSTSNTNPTSTTAGSATDNKGKQLQVLTSRKRNVDDKKKNHKFGIILQNLMVILQPLELNVIIMEMIMHVILLLMGQVICEVI